MNDFIDLDRLRADWQSDPGPSPELSLARLKSRLRRRWLMAALEAAGLVLTLGLLIVFASSARDVLDWIYLGFFAVLLVIITVGTVRLRLTSLWRRDDSTLAVLDHAWRDAHTRERGGWLGLWISPLILIFVLAWLAVVGTQTDQGMVDYLVARWPVLLFVTLWCLMGTLLGAWMLEKGRRQKLDLERLRQALADG